jgi:pectin methylesterase-like acyl-CoA thioesterase
MSSSIQQLQRRVSYLTYEIQNGGGGGGGSSFPFIVSPTSQYTTIQSAINEASLIASATNPQTIFISAGTYYEGGTLPLAPFVNLASIGGVYITANCILTSTGVADTFSALEISF